MKFSIRDFFICSGLVGLFLFVGVGIFYVFEGLINNEYEVSEDIDDVILEKLCMNLRVNMIKEEFDILVDKFYEYY